MNKVRIYTDGACSGNPGPGGWAYLLKYNEYEKLGSGRVEHTTNNQMELLAVIEGLRALNKPCHVEVYTDSQYVQKGISEWLSTWIKNGWRTSQKKPVKNQEYWQMLSEATAGHTISWHWVKGHAGHPENERVDAAACAAIRSSK
jgi:ribonuclease HI